MAIYGLNFNGSQIPPALQRHFAKRTDKNGKAVGADRSCEWLLVGVATSEEERDAMLVQANNGHRQLRVVERKTSWRPVIFGIYAS